MKKKTLKVGMYLVVVVALVMSYLIPIAVVNADTHDVVITFSVANTSDVTLSARGAEGLVNNNVVGDGLVGIRGENQSIIDFKDTANNSNFANDKVSVVCTSNKLCTATITVPNEHGVKAVVGGDTRFKFLLSGSSYGDAPIADGSTIEIVNNDNVNVPFDGKAYLIWSCKNGGTCYHYFNNISTNDSMFIHESTVTDDNTGEVFDVHAKKKNFALKNDFEDWQVAYKTHEGIDAINWRTLDVSKVIDGVDMSQYEEQAISNGTCTRDDDRETFESCVDGYVESLGIFIKTAGLGYVGEPTLNNAYVSYGDRNFKVTIYNDKYRGIEIGSLADLSYYPGSWADSLVRNDSFDISATTKSNPVDIETVLLESSINISGLDENEFGIQTIEALDVPNGAVSIEKVDFEYKIRFNSNFYDKVVFKVTSIDGNEYYFRINRSTLKVQDVVRFRDGQPKVDLMVGFYFDRTTSYSNYSLTATVNYKDGTRKIVNLENAKVVDDGLGNKAYYYEIDHEHPPYGPAGKGLKESTYKYSFDTTEAKKIDKVYINVEYNGSTSTDYAGAFAGSGKGVVIQFEEVA